MKISWVQKQVDTYLRNMEEYFGPDFDEAEPIEVELHMWSGGDLPLPTLIGELTRWIDASDNASATKLLQQVVRLVQGANDICNHAQGIQDDRLEVSGGR